MIDNNPHLEEHDGQITDMLIERLLDVIIKRDFAAPDLDEAFTAVVRRYINEDAPHLVASFAANDKAGAMAFFYYAMLRMDFEVVNKGTARWPVGGFDFMPDAQVAISIYFVDGDTSTDFFPGKNLNHAALGAIVQYARELACIIYNEPELPFGGSKRGH